MAKIRVQVWTAEKTNPEANEDKFYRVYALPNGTAVRQWGSQRTGRMGGQFKADSKAGALAAQSKKLNEGYRTVAQYAFEIDDERLKASDKARAQLLDGVRGSTPEGKADNPSFSWSAAASFAPSPKSSIPTVMPEFAGSAPVSSAPAGSDTLTVLTDRIQAAISLAVEDPAAAMVEMAELGELMDLTAERTLKMRSFYETLELLVADAVMGR